MRGAGHQASPSTIFVVDDDEGLSRLVEKALQREGFRTASAGSFQQAVDWLEDHQPALMLLDLKLQEIGGKELIDHLAAHDRTVPFIIITGQGDERVAVAMMKRGALDYLVKDVDFLQFVPEVVRRALGQLERDRKLAAAEEALRRSKANLARAQQIAHLGSYELNIPPSSDDYYSDEIHRILGLDPNARDSAGKDAIEQSVHPDDRQEYRTILSGAIREAVPFRFEYRVVRPDGTVRHVQSLGEPVLDRKQNVIKLVGTLLDITDRRRAEMGQQVQYATTRALAESTSLLEAAPKILNTLCSELDWDAGEFWETANDGQTLRRVEIWGPPGHGSDGTPERGPTKLASNTGLAGRAWRTGKPVWSVDVITDPTLGLEDLPAGAGLHGAVAVPVLLRAQVLAVVVLFSRDIRPPDPEVMQMFSVLGSQVGQFTERKRAEEALRKEHAFSSGVLDTSAALVVVLDRHGQIIRFNRACEQTTGYSAAEVLGKKLWGLFLVPEELDAVKGIFERLRSGQFPSRHENYWLTRQGERRLIAWSNSALADDAQAIEYVISVGIDVTERRRLEQEILQISEMEQRRIGQDLHDGLCQHLAATELMCQILEQRLAKRSRAGAARVAEIGRQVREAIMQTRLLARGLSPVVVESEGLMSSLQELADYTERMFRVACAFQCELPVLVDDHARATHLYRIGQEAISNAVRHGKAKRIVVSLRKAGERIVLEIKNDGLGLGQDLSKSKGMGLRIMQYRAAMIGGSLSIQNRPDGGVAVTCSIQPPASFDTSSS